MFTCLFECCPVLDFEIITKKRPARMESDAILSETKLEGISLPRTR